MIMNDPYEVLTPAQVALEEWPQPMHPRLGLGYSEDSVWRWFLRHERTILAALQSQGKPSPELDAVMTRLQRVVLDVASYLQRPKGHSAYTEKTSYQIVEDFKFIRNFLPDNEPLLIDWERETNDPLAELTAIEEVYKRSTGKPYPDKEMAKIVRKTKEMLFSWWGWHRERIRAALANEKRIQELEDLLRSACAIAERKGEGTHWVRFLDSAKQLGLNGVTARTYRLLEGDEQ